jgi:hypothetical protein
MYVMYRIGLNCADASQSHGDTVHHSGGRLLQLDSEIRVISNKSDHHPGDLGLYHID